MSQPTVETSTKIEAYQQVVKQAEELFQPDAGLMANLANCSALLRQHFPNFSWVGFYLREGDDLWVGPYQGKVACTHIKVGQGVCGTAAKEKETQCIEDVSTIENHIYCDPDAQSEIVVPIIKKQKVVGVLDIDSYKLGQFDETDKKHLQQLINKLLPLF